MLQDSAKLKGLGFLLLILAYRSVGSGSTPMVSCLVFPRHGFLSADPLTFQVAASPEPVGFG